MVPTTLIDELDRLGVTLQLAGDTIRFHPASKVPASLRDELRAHKAALMQELAARLDPDSLTKAITAGTMTLTCSNRHHEPRFWHETRAIGREGWRVTHCNQCRKFIGYRSDNGAHNE